jgi:hypothetical protein
MALGAGLRYGAPSVQRIVAGKVCFSIHMNLLWSR